MRLFITPNVVLNMIGSAKSIDELYDEVKDYDVVLCNDAPLALALNNRLDITRIGNFAVTPRQLAGDMALDILGYGLCDDVETVWKVSEITGFRLRYVHGEIENIKTMMRYTNDVRNKLGKMSQRIYDEFIEMPTLEKAMMTFDVKKSDIYDGKKVAVIGLDLFDNLDKHFVPLPGKYEEINLFKRGSYEIDEIRELSNDRQIAENVVSLIDRENAKDVAIVLDVGGNIANAVRSALYRKELPFINSLYLKDLNHVRDFLEFVSLSLSFETVKVSQIRELLSTYGGYINSKYDGYLANSFSSFCDNERTKELLQVMKDICSMTYLQVCDAVAKGKSASQIKVLLGDLDLKEKVVNSADTSDMIYAVNNINDLKHNEEIPDNEKEGVLLVDCKNSVYIDRPVVFYVGIGQEWERDLSFLNLVDYRLKDDENDRNLVKFQILLQQGSRRIYVVNSIKDGEKPKPCGYFDLLLSKTASKFDEVCKNIVSGPWVATPEPKILEYGEVCSEDEKGKPFSKTSYDNFASCPREFMYGVILGSPDKNSTVVGNMLHEYAEFRITYPELAKKHPVDYYSDIITEKCCGLFSPEARAVESSKIRNSLTNIDRFVNAMGFDKVAKIDTSITKNNVDDKRKGFNTFIVMEGQVHGSDITEIECISNDGKMGGIFDVIVGDHIYDFKTGSPHDAKDIMDAMDENKKHEYNMEYQCMFYLSMLEEKVKNGKHTFSLFYTNDNINKTATGTEFEIKSNMRHVELINDREYYIRNYLAKEKVLKGTYKPVENCTDELVTAILSAGEDELRRISELLSSKDAKYDVTADPICISVTEFIMNRTKLPNSKAKKISEGFIKDIAKTIDNEKFCSGNTLLVTRKALEDFRKQVAADYDSAKKMYGKSHPAIPVINCKNCYFNDICTAIPTEGGETDA